MPLRRRHPRMSRITRPRGMGFPIQVVDMVMGFRLGVMGLVVEILGYVIHEFCRCDVMFWH